MQFPFALLAFQTLFIGLVASQQAGWGQCGGLGWTGAVTCIPGYYCSYLNVYFSQCIPGNPPDPMTSKSSTSCNSSVCVDRINSCGMTYGGCYLDPSCGGSVPTFTTPPCPPKTTAPPPTISTPPTFTTGCTYTRCIDYINPCGMTYGGCFLDPLCGGTIPTFTAPACTTAITTPPSGCPFTECAYVSNPCGPSIRTCFLAGACGGTTPGPRTSTCSSDVSSSSWVYTTSTRIPSTITSTVYVPTLAPTPI